MKRKILILGGLGFIGTNLVEELIKRDKYEIIIFEAKKIIIQNKEILKKVKMYYGDFNNEKDFEIIFQENQIDLVIHLIGTTTPSKSNENIIYDINSNLINTIKLLNLLKQYNVRKIVFLSSGGTIYGISNRIHGETDPNAPMSSYGIMKLTIEKYIQLFNYLYGLNYLILRPSNPYGEYHKSADQGLINVAIEKILRGEPVEIWGDGSKVRDYIYIKDLVKIITDLIQNDINNEVLNLGSSKGYSINDIMKIIKKELGDFKLKFNDERKVDIPYLVLNIEKLKSFININLTPIEIGIRKTINWLRNRNRSEIRTD